MMVMVSPAMVVVHDAKDRVLKALIIFAMLLLMALRCHASVQIPKSKQPPVYHYFAYGSNVKSSTMRALRRITPINATAAVLPNYVLYFDGTGGGEAMSRNRPLRRQLIESSAAFVAPCESTTIREAGQMNHACVHGVLYTLTANDFARVGLTEGVPLAYRWKRCRVFPYAGDGESAGFQAMQGKARAFVDAYTLVKSLSTTTGSGLDMSSSATSIQTLVPPSNSYLQILQQGAEEWSLDHEHQDLLKQTLTAKNLIIPQGISGIVLRVAELVEGRYAK